MATGRPRIQLPLKRTFIADLNKFAYRIIFVFEIRGPDGNFKSVPVRLDTGTDFMMIPQWLANQQGIPFTKDRPLWPMTAAGRALEASYLAPVYFSFPQMRRWEFKVDCAFSPYGNLRYCLFGMTDFVPHFIVRSQKATSVFPEGSLSFS